MLVGWVDPFVAAPIGTLNAADQTSVHLIGAMNMTEVQYLAFGNTSFSIIT